MIAEQDPPSELAPFYGEVGRALGSAPPPVWAPTPAPRRSWRLELIASVALIVAALGIGIALQQARKPVAPAPAASATPVPSVSATAQIPEPLLQATSLTNTLVTPFDLKAADASDRVLVGAYADPTRVVLFFRGGGDPRGLSLSVYDDQGFLNGATRGGGSAAISYFITDVGPHAGQDGRTRITITTLGPSSITNPQPVPSGWSFQFMVPVHPANPLPASPFELGSWKITFENLGVTPSVIDLQAVFAGVSNQDLYQNFQSQPVALLDASGNVVNPVDQSAGVTVPKQQLNPTTYKNTRVHYQWARPATAATYQLRFTGNGTTHTITVSVPAPSG